MKLSNSKVCNLVCFWTGWRIGFMRIDQWIEISLYPCSEIIVSSAQNLVAWSQKGKCELRIG